MAASAKVTKSGTAVVAAGASETVSDEMIDVNEVGMRTLRQI